MDTTLPPFFDNDAATLFFDTASGLPFSEDVQLQGENVQRITTLAIQVLLAMDISLQQHGHALRIENPSPDMVDTFAVIGLAEVLSRWSTPHQI